MMNYDNRAQFGEFVGECCGATAEYAGSFRECVEEAKRNGWKAEKDEDLDEWFHTCPACA